MPVELSPVQLLGGRQIRAPGLEHANFAEPSRERPTAPAHGPDVPQSAGGGLWGDDGFGFDDLLDIVNPLQHLPIVSVLYRELSGDSLAAAPRVLGGGLFGGVIGLAASFVDAAIAEETGRDIGGHVLAFFTGEEDADATPAPEVMVASAAPREAGREAPPPIDLVPDRGASAPAAPPAGEAPNLSEDAWSRLITSFGTAPPATATGSETDRPERRRSEDDNPPAPVTPASREAAGPRLPSVPGAMPNQSFVALMTANLEKYADMEHEDERAQTPAGR